MRAANKHIVGFPLLAAIFIFTSIFMSAFINVLKPAIAEAAVAGQWQNVQTITVNGHDYVDSNWSDDNVDFKYNDDNGCVSEINGFNNNGDRVNPNGDVDSGSPNAQDTKVDITLSAVQTPGGGCITQKKQTLNLAPASMVLRLATMRTVDGGTIEVLADMPQGSIQAGERFVLVNGAPGGNQRFYRESELNNGQLGKCNDYIELGHVGEDSTVNAKLYEQDGTDTKNGNGSQDRNPSPDGSGCFLTNGQGPAEPDGTVVNVVINDYKNIALPPGTGTATTDTKSSGKTNIGISCNTWSLNPLNWVLCPIVFGMKDAVNALDDAITNIMDIDVDNYFCTSTTADNKPCPNTNGQTFYQVWTSFRNISLIILVIAAIVMVISQAVGMGPFDAYTIRRILPRLIFAIIFISLSWPIVKFLIQFSDVVGRATRTIIQSPFAHAGDKFNIGGGEFALGTAAGGVAIGIAAIGGSLNIFGILSLVFVALIGVIIAFGILIAREILVILLALLAPIAIACYILPNTKKVWDIWWDFFIRALMVFPIIMAFISAGRVFAAVASSTGTVGTIIGFIAYFGPYFALTYAFRLAGGAVGTISGIANDRTKGIFDRQKKFRQEKAAQIGERRGRRITQKRADLQNKWQTESSRRSGVGGFGYRMASRAVGGYNIQHADSLRRAAVAKELNDQINTGRDDEIRGLTVDKAWALSSAGTRATKRADGTWTDGDWRINDDGVRQFKSLGGAWVNEGAVDEGQRRWGHDTYAQQAALSYEMRKASTEDQLQSIAANYGHVAKDAWGMSDNQAGGAWIGAAFENQNQHLEYKYTNWKDGMMNKDRAASFASEIYEKRGSYPLAQMGSNTIEQLKAAHAQAVISGDVATQQKIAGIAETFMSRYGGGAAGGIMTVDEHGVPRTRQPGETTEPTVLTNTPGAAHVAERVRELAVQTGVYQAQPDSTNITPGDFGIGHPGNPRQN